MSYSVFLATGCSMSSELSNPVAAGGMADGPSASNTRFAQKPPDYWRRACVRASVCRNPHTPAAKNLWPRDGGGAGGSRSIKWMIPVRPAPSFHRHEQAHRRRFGIPLEENTHLLNPKTLDVGSNNANISNTRAYNAIVLYFWVLHVFVA